MSLLDSPSLHISHTPVRSSSLPAQAYVLSIAASSSHYAASSSAPSNSIHLFDKADFRKLREWIAHANAITSLRSAPSTAGNVRDSLFTSSRDGYVRFWDDRSGSQPALQMNGLVSSSRRALLSCDVSSDGLTVVAGTDLEGEDASILYWDARNPSAPLRVHTSTHSDDITAVHFSKTNTHLVLSASSDGLICTSNAQEADEDEAGLHVGNAGSSIAQTGWVHGTNDAPSLDQIENADIRQPSVHRQDLTWVTDYLIGCHNHRGILPGHDNDLSVFVGSNEGDVALLTRPSLSNASSPWSLHRMWSTGHTGVVRSVLWDESHNLIITGGEDSRINVWSSPSPFASAETNGKREGSSDDMDVDESMTSPSRKRRRE
ncbi:WD40-repeat-containing domain protein [Cristinia sonorae]|uniref:WD40-repeat-containing domain protein n=1 Tax=Cristinia sonorae TaxID=1940300 RepID=A0A8K0XUK8_9AGAR|nr:WD40-repeat-containing domain protein [Cristinia sonorae]